MRQPQSGHQAGRLRRRCGRHPVEQAGPPNHRPPGWLRWCSDHRLPDQALLKARRQRPPQVVSAHHRAKVSRHKKPLGRQQHLCPCLVLESSARRLAWLCRRSSSSGRQRAATETIGPPSQRLRWPPLLPAQPAGLGSFRPASHQSSTHLLDRRSALHRIRSGVSGPSHHRVTHKQPSPAAPAHLNGRAAKRSDPLRSLRAPSKNR